MISYRHNKRKSAFQSVYYIIFGHYGCHLKNIPGAKKVLQGHVVRLKLAGKSLSDWAMRSISIVFH